MLTVVISTCGDRLLNLVLPNPRLGVKYIVVHQGFGSELCLNSLSELTSRCDVNYFQLDIYGLSKSRNFGVYKVETKYAFIMDDDVYFNIDNMLSIVELMECEGVNIATCQHRYESGEYPTVYKAHSFEHSMLSAANVSSIDICLNVKSVKNKGLCFDESFGLGTDLPSGEEFIFLTDCLMTGLKVKYYPILVGVHPNITSGMDFYTNNRKVLAKREMLKRVFGQKSIFYIIAFWLKKLPVVVKQGHGWRFTKTMLLGG